MTSKSLPATGHMSFEQLEKQLLKSLDDLTYRMKNEGSAERPDFAESSGTASLESLRELIAEYAQKYRARIVMNRFRLAPPVPVVGALMIDPDRPSDAAIDYVRRIAGLIQDGKVVTKTEHERYCSIMNRHKKWKWRSHFPDPGAMRDFIVPDDASLSDGRRPAWMPPEDDELFVCSVLRDLAKIGWVCADDANRYEEIMRDYPKYAEGYPGRVRGAEARRYKERVDGTALAKALTKRSRR